MSDYNQHLSMLPEHMREGMKDYLEKGYKPGSFLTAILSNDLRGAFEKADSINSHRIRDYMLFLYNYAPANSWGSPEAFEYWTHKGGLEGIAKEKEQA